MSTAVADILTGTHWMIGEGMLLACADGPLHNLIVVASTFPVSLTSGM